MKQYSKACERNKGPIGDILDELLPPTDQSLVVEVGSGTGQHGVAFARRFSRVLWQPTDRPGHLQSVRAWRRDEGPDNLCAPRAFDLFDDQAPIDSADLVVAINVIHIAPFEATNRLFSHAAQWLDSGSPILLYGPFKFRDRPLEPSNRSFDEFLQRRDPQSGIRIFEDVDQIAADCGFRHCETRRLPANNDAIWWRRTA